MYRVNEVFYSIQGEGARAGSANVFIRLAGCDLACSFCDTEFESAVEMTAEDLAARASSLMPRGPRKAILTGGEPTLQYDQELHAALRGAGFSFIALETNGGTKPKAPYDWVSVSPKVAEHVLKASFPEGVDELRYVRHPGQGVPAPAVEARHRYLSPQFVGSKLQKESLEWCMKLVRENPEWSLSVQQHKVWGVR